MFIGKAIKTLNKESEDKFIAKKKIDGKVVLVKDNVLGFNDFTASVTDSISEVLGLGISLRLVSSVHGDNANGFKGKIGKIAKLENWIGTLTGLVAGDTAYDVSFGWDESIGIPGAIIVQNCHTNEFFLKTITLNFKDVPGHESTVLVFDCNSWVYPKDKHSYDRVFFTNKSYLPSETPASLRYYREQELVNLRGDGTKQLKEWDRVYDYAFYNDLGNPDKGPKFARQTLGGSAKFPYPRRGRTSRPPSKQDPSCESSLPILQALDVYVPRDERFGHVKMSDFVAYGLKFLAHIIKPAVLAKFDGTEEIDSFDELYALYEGGLKLPPRVLEGIRNALPGELLKELFRSDGEGFPKYPKPQVIQKQKWAWNTDEEFGRETVAGLNPVVIRRLQDFPPTSQLDPKVYGDQSSKITKDQIEKHLEGKGVIEALYDKRLYILDYHDVFIPYVNRINATDTKMYATRTVLLLKDDGTLKPVAIELSLPNSKGEEFGAVSKVYTPATEGVEGTLWTLAKAYVAVNDSGFHQLISHWLNTHAAVEPFIIASHRQLSVVHPVYKLLHPHFRDTMFINGFARQTLINAGAILESTVFPGKFALEFSSVVYKSWVFPDQALPTDLVKRGVAVKDPQAPHGVRLLIGDYPFAVDGLEIWSAISTWVEEYCSFYYKSDHAVQKDTELQAFWKELREVGHGDKKDAPWWPKMQTREELVESCTTLIWITSALHAAVNFGQYPYAGFLPNRPSMSRRLMPEPGTKEYEELTTDPEKAYMKTITSELATILGISIIELLSRHAADEVYLGKRDNEMTWTADPGPVMALKKFGAKLTEIEARIAARNADARLKNRTGPVEFPYTLLMPSSKEGLTARGIPNSVSI